MTRICALAFSILLSTLLPSQVVAQAEDPANPNWGKFHSTADAHALLRGWASMFPRLTSLYSIGETLEGTPLMVLEITNKQTGPADEKPAYYYDGNIHASELTGAEVALHFAWYVLSRYGNDPRITRLLDTRTLYVRPKFNPDGADIALTTPNSLRSTPRPYDEDHDGLLDEDPRNDLDGDGAMTQMRVPNPNGLWKISPSDNRVMVRRGDGEIEGDFYDLLSEGIDNDGDGYFNEDGIGGIDMNRNFPRNWGLEAEQSGAGPYPLSEPETRATIEFINGHRNISGVFHGHTSGGFVFRLPSTTSWDEFNSADQNLILELSRKYEETTGQPARASYTNPRVRALFDKWLEWSGSHHGKRGGCLFVASAVELDDQEGRARDFLVQKQRQWLDVISRSARRAIEAGDFREDVDTEQLAHDLYSIFLGYHHARRLLRDPNAETRTRRAFEQLIANAQ